MSLKKRWLIAPPAPADFMARLPDLSPLVAQILFNRGIDPATARAFLAGEWRDDNPFRLKGMNEAVARLREAIRRNESIAIYGDYDADGVTATVLLTEVLQALGAQVEPYIPHRIDEGYGLNIPALDHLRQKGIRVVVTVDCGVRSVREVEHARRNRLDVIVTDHHAIHGELPPAIAVVNPKQEDCRYPFKELSGVGLAYKLAQALLRVQKQVRIYGQFGRDDACVTPAEDDLLDLVALGTVADIVPILGENRALVKGGLDRLNRPQRLGVKAMLEEANLRDGEVESWHISFILGPRLNAAGRLEHALASYDLLASRSAEEAKARAERLGAMNRERQELTLNTFEQARQEALEKGIDRPLLFLASPSYFSGVVGLVASRLVEEFYRPAIVVEFGAGESRGSCRSIPEFNIIAALDECRDLLCKHGGHAMAAGFTVPNDNLERLASRLGDIAAERLSGVELAPTLNIDAEVSLASLDWATHALLQKLAPFGYGNPQPLLLSRGVQVRDWRVIGRRNNTEIEGEVNESASRGKHLRLTLSDGRLVWDAIAFRQGDDVGTVPERIDVVYTLETKEWQGEKRLQLNVRDFRPSAETK
jgi:single-stranded-DNA-specific exonuclease